MWCVSNVADISELSILDCLFVFYVCLLVIVPCDVCLMLPTFLIASLCFSNVCFHSHSCELSWSIVTIQSCRCKNARLPWKLFGADVEDQKWTCIIFLLIFLILNKSSPPITDTTIQRWNNLLVIFIYSISSCDAFGFINTIICPLTRMSFKIFEKWLIFLFEIFDGSCYSQI